MKRLIIAAVVCSLFMASSVSAGPLRNAVCRVVHSRPVQRVVNVVDTVRPVRRAVNVVRQVQPVRRVVGKAVSLSEPCCE